MSQPRVSVVVSTYNRPARLAALIDSLRSQTLDREAYELVVVDNGSGPETAEVMDREAARDGVALRTIRNDTTRGPAVARNMGWQTARGGLIAFTDDDCRPDPGWLERGLQRHLSAPEALIQGRTEPDPAELEHAGLLSRSQHITALGPQFETCNIFYPRALLERLGGFDERFGLHPAGEDTDLAWRALERGVPAVLADDAIVFHAVERVGVGGQLRVALRWSATARLFARHPRARSMLYGRVFWNVWHYLMWRSLLCLAGPAWLRRLVLARHLLALRSRAREGGAGAAAVPFLLLHDLLECWALARGAARYRTLVL